MDAVNKTAHELRNAVSVPAQAAHAMNTTDGWMDEWMDANTVHGLPLQARVVAANRTVLANCATILAHMAMNKGRGNAKQNQGKNDEGSRHGMAKVGRQTQPAEQGRCRQYSRQTIRPAQAL